MLRLFACFCIAFLAAAACAVPPTVIHAAPDNADTAVDPALTSLRITFDQDMSPHGFSACGGGPSMPAISGNPVWESPRTVLLRVKLEPDHLYTFSINCPSAGKFASLAGESAVPYPISFRTAAIGQAEPVLSAADAASMAQALRSAINDRYSYRDRLKLDWDAVFQKDAALTEARTPAAFARATARLLAPAQDPHLSVKVGEFTLPTHFRAVTPNINTRWISRNIPDLKRLSPAVLRGTCEGSIGYLLISSWTGTPADFAPIDEAIDQFNAAKVQGLILDVRPNSGGSESLAGACAAHFIDAKSVYSRSRLRDATAPSGFTGPFDRSIEPAAELHRFAGKVAVLVGPANLSSCESFILMMKQSPRVRTFGGRTGGSSGNPKPIDLGHGVVLFTPSWIDLLPDNTQLEGTGLAPDEPVDAAPAMLEKSDPVLQAALAWLKK